MVLQVRTAAGNALLGVSRLVKTQDLGHCVLTILLQLAHDDEVEEQRMTAVTFIELKFCRIILMCESFAGGIVEKRRTNPGTRLGQAVYRPKDCLPCSRTRNSHAKI